MKKILKMLQFNNQTSSSDDAGATCSDEFGDPLGKVNNGSLVADPWTAKPNAYPRARDTGTATAFPTWMYLKRISK